MKQARNLALIQIPFLLCLSCISLTLHADEEQTESDLPSLEFLEFLGQFETEDGQWADPITMNEMLDLTHISSNEKESDDE